MIGIHITNGPRVGQFEDIDAPPDWTDAACRDEDPEIWFPKPKPGRETDYSIPREICAACPIRERCLEYAMQREGSRAADSRWGMWGGLTGIERANLARRRRRAK